MISYVENGGETPVALELLEQTKRLDSLLEGLVGIAIVLADQKRYEELDVVYKQLVSYLGKLDKHILDEEELPLRSLIIKLIDRLTRTKQYTMALQVIEIVKSIDEALATSLVSKLTRTSLALNDLPGLINALKRYSHIVDDSLITVIINNITFKYMNILSLNEIIKEVNGIAKGIEACIERKAKHLNRIIALSKCLRGLSVMIISLRPGIVVRREWFGGLIYNVYDVRERYYLTNDMIASILYAVKNGLKNIEDISELLNKLGYDTSKEEIIKIIRKLKEFNIITYERSEGRIFYNDGSSDEIFLKVYKRLKKMNELANRLRNERSLLTPYLVVLNPTLYCNLNCIFCYSSTLAYEQKYTQPMMRYKEYVRLINLLAEANVALIDIFGGEPMLHPDIDKILSELLDYNFNIVLSTNATYVSRDVIRILNKKGNKNIHINISMQSIDPTTHDTIVGVKGALKRTLDNLFKLKDIGVSLGVGVVVTKFNINHLESLAEWLLKNGIDQMVLFYMHKVGKALINDLNEISLNEFISIISELKSKYKEKGLRIVAEGPFLWYLERAKIPKDPFAIYHYAGCHLRLKIEILPNGTITPCILLAKYLHSEKRITQFKGIDDFSELWLNFQRVIDNIFNNIIECKECNYAHLCKFTCRGFVYQKFGDIHQRDPRCPIKY